MQTHATLFFLSVCGWRESTHPVRTEDMLVPVVLTEVPERPQLPRLPPILRVGHDHRRAVVRQVLGGRLLRTQLRTPATPPVAQCHARAGVQGLEGRSQYNKGQRAGLNALLLRASRKGLAAPLAPSLLSLCL
jgi:hypothetical protein